VSTSAHIPRQAPAAAVVVALLVALLLVGGASAEPAEITSKRAEAERVLAEVREIDVEVGAAAEAWNLANIRLAEIESQQKQNQKLLKMAGSNLAVAQQALEARLVAIYTSGTSAGAIEVILGAESLEDLLDRVETASRVSEQDKRTLDQVRQYRRQVEQQKQKLAKARTDQARIVAERAAQKAQIEAKLAERERLLAGIRSEIGRLQAEEQRRQAELVRQAQARLAAERRAASRAATPSAPPSSDSPATAVAVSAPAETTGTTATVAAEPAPAAPAPAPAQAPPARYGGVVGIAMRYVGVPYKWGGSSPSTGFDCSGFTKFVYAQVGVNLPHNAAMQFQLGRPVSRSELQPGDLVFFHGLGHMGLYIGGGNFIHAPQTGDVVKISPLSGWYSSRFVGARRL
jgi:peptidoglycan DL-endopeptidase CwlO